MDLGGGSGMKIWEAVDMGGGSNMKIWEAVNMKMWERVWEAVLA